MKNLSLFVVLLFFCGLSSCSQELDSPISIKNQEKISIEKVSSAKSDASGRTFTLYDVLTPGKIFKNVVLSEADVQLCNGTRISGEVIPQTVYGYDSYDTRSKSYQLYIHRQAALGIPDGYYIVQDIWVYKTVSAPGPAGVAFAHNDYADHSKMGYDPNALNQPGLTCSMNSNTGKVNLQTGAILVVCTLSGQQVNMTMPLNIHNLEWHYYFLPL